MRLDGASIYVRLLEEPDARALLDLRLRNRGFFELYEPRRPDEFFTIAGQLEDVRRSVAEREEGREHAFGIFLRGNDRLVGRITLSGITRGAFQSAFLGYFLDEGLRGRGHTTEAVGLVLDLAFGELGLHRVQAGVMPRNTASIRVLEKNGFREEGYAPRYLLINGVWEDHKIFAVTAEER